MPRPAVLAALLAFAPGLSAQDALTPPPKNAYIKVRVEVEVRGVLKVTDKGAVVMTRYTYYENGSIDKVSTARDGVPAYKVELDFTRAKDFQELAKTLNGREVVLTGMSELRNVLPPPSPPGGGTGFTGGMAGGFGFVFPTPTWQLHPTIQVTGLRLPAPAEKR